jgi:hypothetical protein
MRPPLHLRLHHVCLMSLAGRHVQCGEAVRGGREQSGAKGAEGAKPYLPQLPAQRGGYELAGLGCGLDTMVAVKDAQAPRLRSSNRGYQCQAPLSTGVSGGRHLALAPPTSVNHHKQQPPCQAQAGLQPGRAATQHQPAAAPVARAPVKMRAPQRPPHAPARRARRAAPSTRRPRSPCWCACGPRPGAGARPATPRWRGASRPRGAAPAG